MKRIGITAALLLALFIGFGIYGQLNKPSAKSKRLQCQEEVSCFERSYGTPEQLSEATALLEARAYRIAMTTQPSVYMESRLFESLDPARTQQMIADAIERHIPKSEAGNAGEEPLLIECLIYENDKKDPGKKSKKAFLYEGYLLFTLSHAGQRLYKFQIDFMQPKGADIAQRIDCAVQSIITLHKKEH